MSGQDARSAAQTLFEDADFGEPTNDRERILLAEIARLRKERDEAVESSAYYLRSYKRVYGELVDEQKSRKRPLPRGHHGFVSEHGVAAVSDPQDVDSGPFFDGLRGLDCG